MKNKLEVSEENKSVVRLLVRRVSELKVNQFSVVGVFCDCFRLGGLEH